MRCVNTFFLKLTSSLTDEGGPDATLFLPTDGSVTATAAANAAGFCLIYMDIITDSHIMFQEDILDKCFYHTQERLERVTIS